ncbi:MAG: hypothetical protein ACRD9S_19540 [Pyrinomonadaceae bacterium]
MTEETAKRTRKSGGWSALRPHLATWDKAAQALETALPARIRNDMFF